MGSDSPEARAARARERHRALVEDFRYLWWSGIHHPETLCTRLGFARKDTLVRALIRAGRPDLAARLVPRSETSLLQWCKVVSGHMNINDLKRYGGREAALQRFSDWSQA